MFLKKVFANYGLLGATYYILIANIIALWQTKLLMYMQGLLYESEIIKKNELLRMLGIRAKIYKHIICQTINYICDQILEK